MPDLTRHTKLLLTGALLAGLTLAACGGDDKGSDSATSATVLKRVPAASTTGPSGTTQSTDKKSSKGKESTDQSSTATDQSANTPAPKDPNAEVIAVADKPTALKVGGLTVKVKMTRVVDPVKPDVDEAQPGNRLLGVFVESQASGKYEPSRVVTIAALTTKDGKTYPVRVMSGGECEGSFFPAAFLVQSKKLRSGCIGFEIPKGAKPEEIVLGVRSTTTGKSQSRRWKLPAAQ